VSTPQIKFQQLLRELFQFDCADLDFGIYRIMNFKRAIIERFISEDLPRLVNDELNKGALAAQSQAARAGCCPEKGAGSAGRGCPRR
jgi:adenine-specific DNA-methyltransferase